MKHWFESYIARCDWFCRMGREYRGLMWVIRLGRFKAGVSFNRRER